MVRETSPKEIPMKIVRTGGLAIVFAFSTFGNLYAATCLPTNTDNSTLINCISNASSGDVVDLNSQTFTLTSPYLLTDNGLPPIVLSITVRNGTIRRLPAAPF